MTVSKDHYYRLASELEDERIGAAVALVSELKGAAESDWDYAYDRLIKGLSSTRTAARIGFSMCLSEVISLLAEKGKFDTDAYLHDLDVKLAATTSKNNGRSERALLFGRLFGLQALLNSEFMKSQLESASLDPLLKANRALVALALVKPWIREAVFFAVQQTLVRVVSDSKFTSVVLDLLQQIHEAGLTLSTEGLLIHLTIPASLRAQVAESVPNGWKGGNPVLRPNLQTLAKILKEAPIGDSEAKQKSNWTPTLPHAWKLLFAEIIAGPEDDAEAYEVEGSKKRKKGSAKASSKKSKTGSTEMIKLNELWTVGVDEQLFALSASSERKFTGFELFMFLIQFPGLPVDQVAPIFSPNFLRTLINQSSKQERTLKKVSDLVLKTIVNACTETPEKCFPVLKALLSAAMNFDRLSKSKTVESVINAATDADLVAIVEFVTSLPSKQKEISEIVKTQTFVLDTLLHLVRARKQALEDSEWLAVALDYIVRLAFFKSKAQPDFFSDRISEIAHERMNSILAEILHLSRNDGFSWTYGIVKTIEADTDLTLRNVFDEEVSEFKTDAMRTLEAIVGLKQEAKKKNIDKVKLLDSFELLFSSTVLQLYSGDPESVELFQELQIAYENRLLADDDASTDEATGILVDIILSYLTHQSLFTKKLAMTVWGAIVDDVKAANLDLLYEILNTKENKQGLEKIFNRDSGMEVSDEEHDHDHDHDHDHSEDESADSSEDEDQENEDEAESSDEEDGDEDTPAESAESSESESEEDVVKEVDRKTTVALASALGIPASADGEVKFDSSDEGSESDVESMSDEQMMAMDDQLSMIFKERQNALADVASKSGNARKLEVQDAKRTMVMFKSRVLDLLEVFVAANPDSELILSMLCPLIDLIDLTQEKSIGEKAHKLLKLKVCKAKVALSGDYTPLLDLIRELQKRADKSSVSAHSNACSQSCIFVAKTILRKDETALEKIVGVYSESLVRWSTSKSKIQPSFYIDFVNWLGSRRAQN